MTAVGGAGDVGYLKLLDELRHLHLEKSAGYGTETEPLANFIAVAHVMGQETWEYPAERSVEKLARVSSLMRQGRHDDLGEEFKDIASLMLCAEALRRR